VKKQTFLPPVREKMKNFYGAETVAKTGDTENPNEKELK